MWLGIRMEENMDCFWYDSFFNFFLQAIWLLLEQYTNMKTFGTTFHRNTMLRQSYN